MKIKIGAEMYDVTGAEDKTLKTILAVISKVLSETDRVSAIKSGLGVINAAIEIIPVEMEM